MGNGDSIRGTGLCENVVILLGEAVVKENFLPIELGNSDIILGVEWLEKLGTVESNWK